MKISYALMDLTIKWRFSGPYHDSKELAEGYAARRRDSGYRYEQKIVKVYTRT